ncbi:hypothetical protein [Arenimonas sp.]|uniref:hypothetical protein n=1 Tax=Arenimonas sp. TaxID=1872635 RepID=UPI0039E26B92
MSAHGLRKTALYLASLPADEQRSLLVALPAEAQRALKPLIAHVAAQGWAAPELVGRVLAEEMRGLTAESALSVDALLALGKTLPADWTARVFAATPAIDSKFLLGLLDTPLEQRVQEHLAAVPRLPDRLRDALLAEAAASVRTA